MAQKLCIYCHKVTLEGFDETERKYYEKGSKTLHTRERCEAAKLGTTPQQQTNSANSQELADLNTKIDRALVLLNDIQQRISGQGSLDVET
jgi:hypothetical protein